MGLIDKAKDAAKGISKRNQELRIKLHITSGKKNLALGMFTENTVLRVDEDGYIYFDEIDGLYKISDFQWDGALYESITTTTGEEKTSVKGHVDGRQKRTGRGIGALAGFTVVGPAGSIAGAMLGTGNKKTRNTIKGSNTTQINTTTVNSQREVASTAYMTLIEVDDKHSFSIGFDCDSKIYGELRNVFLVAAYDTE